MIAIHAAEQGLVPDWLLRLGIQRRVSRRARSLERGDPRLADFRASLDSSPIALQTEAANHQHYEVPAEFFTHMLGPCMKYSSCLFEHAGVDLAQAEVAMLELTAERARIEPGMRVLELGCGWGSLSLFVAERFPDVQLTAVSNSTTQRAYIQALAARRGLTNLQVEVADMNDFDAGRRFDRVVSVEMFEHMRNWPALFDRVHRWLEPDGRLFLHVFCHRHSAYPFQLEGEYDWMAHHFFAEGMMPSLDLLAESARSFDLLETAEVNGTHYARTLRAWLERLDANRADARRVLRDAPRVQLQRWRMFLLASAELFDYDEGKEWFVLHALLAPSTTRAVADV